MEIEQEILSPEVHEQVTASARIESDPKLEEDYLGFAASVGSAGREAGRHEDRARLRQWRGQRAWRRGLFRSLGADVLAMNDRPDGRNINAGCGSLHPEVMQKKVVETRAALGVAFDGDADRAIFS